MSAYIVRVGVVSVAAWVCAVTTAAAQAGWLGPSTPIAAQSGTLRSINAPDVAADQAGNALATWWEMDTSVNGAIFVARYDAAADAWSAPQRVTDASVQTASSPRVVMDASGNGLAMWSQTGGTQPPGIYSARYSAGTHSWSPAELRAPGDGPRLAMNATGDAVAVWSVYFSPTPGPLPGVYASRFAAAGASWSAPERIGPSVQTGVPGIDVALDADGDAFAVWHYTTVEVRRYSAATGVWDPARSLSAVLPGPPPGGLLPVPRVAVNPAGDAVVSWTSSTGVAATRYQRDSDTWTPGLTLAGGNNDSQRAVVDSAGNIVLAWHHNTVGARTLQACRFDANTLSWTSPRDLAPPSAPIPLIFNFGAPALAVDTRNNVLVLSSWSPDGITIQMVSSFFAQATGAWTAAADLARAGLEARLPALAADGSGGAMAVWFEYGPISTYRALRWTSAPATPVVGTVTPAPGQVSVAFAPGPVLDPGLAPTAVEYSLDGGTTWTTSSSGGASPPLVVQGLTDGQVSALRLRAVNSAGRGPAAPTIGVTSGLGGGPGNVRIVAREGNRLTFAWTRPTAGLMPAAYELQGGIGSQVLAVVPSGGAALQMTLTVPEGTFFVRVVGTAGSARTLSSASLDVVAAAAAAPSAPANLLGSTVGSALALSWRTTWEGAPVTGARLVVTGALTASLDLPPGESFTFPAVPPGTYTFAVSSVSGAVVGPPSPPVTLTFPGTCGGAPASPPAFGASSQGGTVFLDWLPPAAGEAVTSYLVSVTGAFTGTFPIAARTLAAPVPPGSYTIRVASVGPCGTSAFTAAATVVVP